MKKLSIKERFLQSMNQVSKELGKPASDITVAEYTGSESKSKLSEWELRKNGGLNGLKNLYFPVDKDLERETLSKLVKNQRSKLENKYGKEILIKEDFLSTFKEVMQNNPIVLHKPIKEVKAKKNLQRSVVVHFSDMHYGCNISKSEMNGLNEYNWTIAARRTAFVFDQAVKYKPQHRDNTELIVSLNGDVLAGVIHDQEWGVDLITTQFAGALSILTQGISYVAGHYTKVRVVCTTGNHDRVMHKASKDRAMNHKWDSFTTMLYLALRETLTAKHTNIEFDIPESPYAIINIQGHKFFQSHGDNILNVGNPGKSINMSSINQQINKLNTQVLKGPENFAGVIVGHVHVNTVQLTDSGTMLLINGSLSGTDSFAQAVGVFNNHPTQTLFEVTEDHAVGDIRLVQVLGADNMYDLDKIIKPFEGKF